MNGFQAAYDYVQAAAGLTFPASRVPSITQVFAEAMAERRLATSADLVNAMQSDASLRDDVVARLTVGETYFFRDPGQFAVIRERVLPDILDSKPAGGTVRMWSAAAASGEEAYTLAIITEQLGIANRCTITATDIARPRLATAQQARFKKWSLRGVDNETIDQYFTRERDNFILASRLRDRVEFKYLNLAEDAYPSLGLGIFDMDLIMCRNVMIYFDEATVCRVAQRLMDSLGRNGWLLIGASDPPISQLVECDVVTTAAGLAYRRAGAGGEQSVSGHPQQRSVSAWTGIELAASEPFAFVADERVREEPRLAPLPVEQTDTVDATAIGDATVVAPHQQKTALEEAIGRVRSMCNTGDTREAATEAVRALEVHGDAAELHYLLAVALSHENQNAEAIRAAKRALYLDRAFVIAHVLLGQLFVRTQDRDGALRSFRNAADLLEKRDAAAIVPATDGERAGRIREVVAVQLKLLRAAA